ncbi:hypothetical protein K491DRAFT_693107 [Lophiostoma macrostomum CBS 122681]|uniref:Uncharacterized protein n=1 Tax=Lophiostoma macrostomum CBS 122681 TaxID=1314788 RepID=A0A6A6T587_9PLEO|nr:hypothetical protein K491DRAFT_693107 [Lophiostoma macrostomum CBS 122681]
MHRSRNPSLIHTTLIALPDTQSTTTPNPEILRAYAQLSNTRALAKRLDRFAQTHQCHLQRRFTLRYEISMGAQNLEFWIFRSARLFWGTETL